MDSLTFLNRLAETKTPYNLGAGVPPLGLYPTLDLAALLQAFSATSPRNIIAYHETPGIITELAATCIAKREKVAVEAASILVTNGVQEGIGLSLLACREVGVACLDPYYPGFKDAAETLGIACTLLDRAQLADQLRQLKPRTLVYFCSEHDNPTGTSLSMDERHEILRIAEERDLFIFEDTTYREFQLMGEVLPSLYALNPARVLLALSFSKILAPGLRVAFLAIPPALRAKLIPLKALMSLNTSGITQAIVGGWLQAHDFEINRHLGPAIAHLRENHRLIDASRFAPTPSIGGFFRVLDFPGRNAGFEFCAELLEKAQIAACPMAMFSQHDKYQSSIRVALAGIGAEALQHALGRLENYL